jgi:hypothetical protein
MIVFGVGVIIRWGGPKNRGGATLLAIPGIQACPEPSPARGKNGPRPSPRSMAWTAPSFGCGQRSCARSFLKTSAQTREPRSGAATPLQYYLQNTLHAEDIQWAQWKRRGLTITRST